MDIQLTMYRIYSARMAAIRATNPWFKEYWHDVANHFEAKLKTNG